MKHISFLSSTADAFHRLHATCFEATGSDKPPAICVHGLARNCRDFDELGMALSREHGRSVYAIDMPGRGESEWLKNAENYCFPQYLTDLTALISHIGAEKVDWVGTSMGGILGMLLASMSGTPINKLVLNDVGGIVPKESLKRIACYMTAPLPELDDMAAMDAYIRFIYSGFGQLTDAQWAHMAKHSAKKTETGKITLNYDPALWNGSQSDKEDINLWPLYDKIIAPTLLIRGAGSDILPKDVAEEMTKRGPKAELYVVNDAAHAPALMNKQQIDRIAAFLAT